MTSSLFSNVHLKKTINSFINHVFNIFTTLFNLVERLILNNLKRRFVKSFNVLNTFSLFNFNRILLIKVM